MLKSRSLTISTLLFSTANNIQNTTKLITSPLSNLICNNDTAHKLYRLENKLVQTKNTEMGSVKNFTQRFQVKTLSPASLQTNRLWVPELHVEPRSSPFTYGGENKYNLRVLTFSLKQIRPTETLFFKASSLMKDCSRSPKSEYVRKGLTGQSKLTSCKAAGTELKIAV